MSTFGYASLTEVRQKARPATTTTTAEGVTTTKTPSTGGVGTFVDALAALVPTEVLTLHGLIVSYALAPAQSTIGGAASAAPAAPAAASTAASAASTAASAASKAAASAWHCASNLPCVRTPVTSLPCDSRQFLCVMFWVLAVLPVFIYVFSKASSWRPLDFARMLVAPLAFVAWTMIQPTTMFDAAFCTLPGLARYGSGLVLAVVLGAIAKWLAGQAGPAV